MPRRPLDLRREDTGSEPEDWMQALHMRVPDARSFVDPGIVIIPREPTDIKPVRKAEGGSVNPFDQFDGANPFDQFDKKANKEDGGIGATFHDIDASIAKGILKGIGQSVQGAGTLGSALARKLGIEPVDIGLQEFGQGLREDAERTYPYRGQENLSTKVGEFAGGVLPYFAVPGGAPAQLAAGAAGMGLAGAQGSAEEAKAAQAPQETQDTAALAGFVPGALMGLIPGNRLALISKLPAVQQKALYGYLTRGLEQGAIAGTVTGVGQAINNYIAQNLYDPNRSIGQGVPEAATVGAIGGALLHGTVGELGLARERAAEAKAKEDQEAGSTKTPLLPQDEELLNGMEEKGVHPQLRGFIGDLIQTTRRWVPEDTRFELSQFDDKRINGLSEPGVIKLAIDSDAHSQGLPITQTVAHEAFHQVADHLGQFFPNEHRAMMEAFKDGLPKPVEDALRSLPGKSGGTALDEYHAQRVELQYDREQLPEERAALAFELYAQANLKGLSKPVDTFFGRIWDWLKDFGNRLRGRGIEKMETPQDYQLFREIYSGGMRDRLRNEALSRRDWEGTPEQIEAGRTEPLRLSTPGEGAPDEVIGGREHPEMPSGQQTPPYRDFGDSATFDEVIGGRERFTYPEATHPQVEGGRDYAPQYKPPRIGKTDKGWFVSTQDGTIHRGFNTRDEARAFAKQNPSLTAYHGSPHDFDRFDIRKVKTGEGNTMYGWGLYFAKAKQVAEAYKEMLGKGALIKPDGSFVDKWEQATQEIKRIIDKHGFNDNIKGAITDNVGFNKLSKMISWHLDNSDAYDIKRLKSAYEAQADFSATYKGDDKSAIFGAEEANLYREAADVLGKMEQEGYKTKNLGKLYRVRIDLNHSDMLHWDKPIDKQPAKIKKIIKDMGIGLVRRQDYEDWEVSNSHDLLELHNTGWTVHKVEHAIDWMNTDEVPKKVMELYDNYMNTWKFLNHHLPNDATGEDLYFHIAARHAPDGANMGDPKVQDHAYRMASIELKDAGIPGMAYLDQFSRGDAEHKTHNYVLFDDRQVKIISKASLTHLPEAVQDPAHTAEMDRLFGGRDTRPLPVRIWSQMTPQGIRDVYERAYQATIDAVDPARRREMRRKAAGRVAPDQELGSYSAHKTATLAARSSSMVVEGFKNGFLEMVGDPAGHGGLKITGNNEGPLTFLKPLFPTKDRGDLIRPWATYMVAQRGQRLLGEGREHLVTADTIRIANELLRKYPEFKDIGDKWIEWNNKNIDALVATGYLKQSLADEWKRTGDYFPFYRQLENDLGVQGPFTKGTGFKATEKFVPLKGGDQKIGDPIENMVRNWNNIVSAAHKNLAGQRLMRDMVLEGGAVPLQEDSNGRYWTDSAGAKQYVKKGQYVTKVRYDGDEKHFLINDYKDFVMMDGLAGSPTSDIVRIMSIPARVLRTMTTKNPAFIAIAHPMRESLQNYVVSREFMIPFLDTLRGSVATITNNPSARAFKGYGGAPGYDYASGRPEQMAKIVYKDMQAGGRYGIVRDTASAFRQFWRKYDHYTEFADMGTRVRIFEKEMARHNDPWEATFQAFDRAVNFQRHGSATWMRSMASLIPFLNARIQGMDMLFRALHPRAENAGQTWMKAMSLAAATVAYYELVKDHPMYKRASEEFKDNYFVIPLHDKYALMIPSPFEVGVLFKTPFEHLARLVHGQDSRGDMARALVRAALDTMHLNPIPHVALPTLEAIGNYSTFTGRQIDPDSQKDLPPYLRYGTNTSETAKKLASLPIYPDFRKGVDTASANKIDHLIRGYFGTMGMYAVDVIDEAMRKSGAAPEKPTQGLAGVPVVKRFLKDTRTIGDADLNHFYELREQVTQLTRGVNKLKEEGRFDEVRKIETEGNRLRSIQPVLNQMAKQLSDLRKAERMIYADPRMSGDEKRSRLDKLMTARDAITSQVERMRQVVHE